ncbi:hypothetical protein Y032_0017g3413 [Ancylostoma ceylanicum]|uniref:Uncharacterized protein n=1 Tax=Ancylostoma ceylanicum TaxID=53326 RepID=A0A016V5N8_9BILA|nr:hypothetical protein Y032_0017g3413 [Ancylostoma ceylanicum]
MRCILLYALFNTDLESVAQISCGALYITRLQHTLARPLFPQKALNILRTLKQLPSTACGPYKSTLYYIRAETNTDIRERGNPMIFFSFVQHFIDLPCWDIRIFELFEIDYRCFRKSNISNKWKILVF